jgi:hypothetical protein
MGSDQPGDRERAMIRTLKPVLISILVAAGLPLAVSQNTVPPPPAKRLPRGCVYFYQPPVMKVPREVARNAEGALTLSFAQPSFKRRPVRDYFFTATQNGKAPPLGPFWPSFQLVEDTSPWTIMCGLHGLHDGESTK